MHLKLLPRFKALGDITLNSHLANCYISHSINHKYTEDNTIQSNLNNHSQKMIQFLIYIVRPLLFLIAALTHLIIVSIKLWQYRYSLDISFTQTFFIASNPDCFQATRGDRCRFFSQFFFFATLEQRQGALFIHSLFIVHWTCKCDILVINTCKVAKKKIQRNNSESATHQQPSQAVRRAV